MSTHTAEPPPDPDELVQYNVRIPRWLRDAVDARRAPLELSRDRWTVRALQFVLAQPGNPRRARKKTVARTSRGRSVKPAGGK